MTSKNNAPADIYQYSGPNIPPRGLSADATPEDWEEQRRQTEEYHRWEEEQERRPAAAEQERIAAMVREAMAGSEHADTEAAARISDVLLGGGRTAILKIAHDRDAAANDRMQDIIRIDSTWAGKDSGEWAELLGVTAQAIRQTACWASLREKYSS